MASAASASIRALAPPPAQPPPDPNTDPAPAIPSVASPTPLPQAPTLDVANPATTGQEAFIRAQLDPTSAAFLGNKYTGDITQAGTQLKSDLTGFGDFNFTKGDMGVLGAPQENVTGGTQMGENYRKATIDALAAQNAKGMISSRLSDEAVGQAWSRLNSQKRDFMTRYATTVSTALKNMQTETSNLTSSLIDLYGQDVQYALDNPILTPAAAADTTPDVVEGGVDATGAALPAGLASKQWTGTNTPDIALLAKSWGVGPNRIHVTRSGSGKYVARIGDIQPRGAQGILPYGTGPYSETTTR